MCICPSGAVAPPGGCPKTCAPVACAPPLSPVDTTSDGCADACAVACASDCDCAQTGLAPAGCDPACSGCEGTLSCQGGLCTTACKAEPVASTPCLDVFCAVNSDCPGGVCLREACAGFGRCATKAEVCTVDQALEPVCDCAGTTWPSACDATAAGAAIAHPGACVSACPALVCPAGLDPLDLDGDLCPDHCAAPCAASADCPETTYCRRRPDACADKGHCLAPPTACPALSQPVCGCDAKTYDSACAAAQALTSVATPGACK